MIHGPGHLLLPLRGNSPCAPGFYEAVALCPYLLLCSISMRAIVAHRNILFHARLRRGNFFDKQKRRKPRRFCVRFIRKWYLPLYGVPGGRTLHSAFVWHRPAFVSDIPPNRKQKSGRHAAAFPMHLNP